MSLAVSAISQHPEPLRGVVLADATYVGWQPFDALDVRKWPVLDDYGLKYATAYN